jgi:hypothetical protein
MNPLNLAMFSNVISGDGIIILLVLLLLTFPIWMIIDCVTGETDERNDRVVWLLVIIFVPLGSLIYFFARKLPRGTLPKG